MQAPPDTLLGAGVVLRRATPADALDLYGFASDPEVMLADALVPTGCRAASRPNIGRLPRDTDIYGKIGCR